MHGEHSGNPRHRSNYERQRVDEAASGSDAGRCVQNDDEEKPDANPRIDAEIKSGVREG
jgi:hypothetical protein